LTQLGREAYTKAHAFVNKHVIISLDRQKPIVKSGRNGSNSSHEKYTLLQERAIDTQARDTSAMAFGNIMFELARRPQVWEQLRTECLALGRNS